MDFDAPARAGLHTLLAVACGASAGFDAALVPAHVETPEAAALFAVSALVLLALAVAIERGARTLVIVAALALLSGLIATYTASRIGVVWPLDHREPVDAIGVTTKLLEAVGLALAVRLLQIQRTAAKVPSGETRGIHA